jgi:subtilisin family serine protease
MHGTRSLWAGGEGRLAPLKVWADGTRSLWAGGVFSPLPGNSDVLRFAGLDTAQARAPRLGAGVTVAVIDTGLDLDHPAFAGALAPRGDWWDFHDGDAVPQEQGPNGPGYGHGTSVASIVLQVAPGARILPLRVLGPGGSGDALNVQRAIDHAVERGAKVINLSLGSVQRSNVVKQAVARAARQNVLVVSSAGNENRQGLTYPAADADQSSAGERSVSVGSVSVTGVKSVFSNFDRNLELTAPGEAVLGAYPENRVAEWSGTSMAAPLASGALALALGQDGALDVRGLTDLLIDSARDVYAHPQNRPYVGQLGERGSLDVARFLERALRPTKPQS